MKKKITLGVLLSFFGCCAFAQTIVTTTPENRKVILEEFTGVNCTNQISEHNGEKPLMIKVDWLDIQQVL